MGTTSRFKPTRTRPRRRFRGSGGILSPQSYELSAESETEFAAFAAAVMAAVDRAVEVDGDRIRIAAKRFLRASFKLPSHSVRGGPDEDVAEDVLLGLVRVGDGLLGTSPGEHRPRSIGSSGTAGLQEVFMRRTTILRDGPLGVACRMWDAYEARSAIAHGDRQPRIPNLWSLFEDMRFVFLGYLGLISHFHAHPADASAPASPQATREAMLQLLNAGDPVPPEARRLQGVSWPVDAKRGHPTRRSVPRG